MFAMVYAHALDEECGMNVMTITWFAQKCSMGIFLYVWPYYACSYTATIFPGPVHNFAVVYTVKLTFQYAG